jgi:hypothetical protein
MDSYFITNPFGQDLQDFGDFLFQAFQMKAWKPNRLRRKNKINHLHVGAAKKLIL